MTAASLSDIIRILLLVWWRVGGRNALLQPAFGRMVARRREQRFFCVSQPWPGPVASQLVPGLCAGKLVVRQMGREVFGLLERP